MGNNMTLSDIKFKYLDKIQNVDNRIDKYQSIILNYNKTIEKAENEETQNISSVLHAKSDYEKRIENMYTVKEYYQEFVKTADYLMQNLNKEKSLQLILKNEQLSEENEMLKKEKKRLEVLLDEAKRDVEIQKMLKEYEEDKFKALKETGNQNMKKVKDENNSLKKLKKDNKKLSAEIQMLLDTNDFLKRKCQNLEEYCNDLLNRKTKPHDSLLKEQYLNFVDG